MKPLISTLKKNKSSTIEEIVGQPNLWKDVYRKICEEKEEIENFLINHLYQNKNKKIILTGAGSSAFIGEIARYSFKNFGFKNTEAIPTTDLVTHFKEIIDLDHPTLFISFGRSGNSPESEAVVNLANKYCKSVSHLIITCNKNGKLAENSDVENTHTFVLPPNAEDKGLAMTGSFSGMVLAASLIADFENLEQYSSQIDKVSKAGNKILTHYLNSLRKISSTDFNRIIFLGDGPNLGSAREAHLKVQELSDGICIGKFDSFLGFRHGPKAVVDEHSLLVYFLSNKSAVIRYQVDLIQQISKQELGMHILALGGTEEINDFVDTNIFLPETRDFQEHLLTLPYIVAAQIIGFFKSQSLSLDPDNPSQNGAISRVVEGVTIY